MSKYETLFKLDVFLQDVFGKAITIKRKITNPNSRNLMNKNLSLKEKKKSNICNVLGLGPSLSDVDYKNLEGDFIVVNRFHKFDKGSISPIAYILCDGAFYQEPLISELVEIYKLYPGTLFLLNGLSYDIIKKRLPDDDRVLYIYYGGGVFNHKDEIDYSKWVPIKLNVVAEAISVAMYMNYKEINLYGCDFNSFASQKSVHCYEEKDNDRSISLSFELFCYSFAAYIHTELSKYADDHGIKIINRTKGSLIDAYIRD